MLCPVDALANLQNRELEPLPRNSFSEKEMGEHSKTARAVDEFPWSLNKASKYLRDLVSCNRNKQWPNPRAIRFVFEHELPLSVAMPAPPEWAQFAPLPPRVISIGPQQGKAKGKRKSAVLDTPNVVPELPDQNQPSATTLTVQETEPVAKGNCKGKAKAKAKGKPKGKCKGKPVQKANAAGPETGLGCSKCRMAQSGCAQCRARKQRRVG